MKPQDWVIIFVGTASNGQKRSFEVDIKKYAAEVLVPALQDLRSPQCCPICLTQYASLILRPGSERYLKELLENEHGLFDACAAVLSESRTIDDLVPLRRVLDSNIARCATKIRHKYLDLQINDPVHWFVSSLYQLIVSPFTGGPRPLLPRTSFPKSRKGVWPTTLDSFFPRGTEAGISAHVFWCHTLTTRVSFYFMAMVLMIARPAVWPHVVAYPQRVKLLKSTLAMLDIGCSRLPSPSVDKAGVLPSWAPLADYRQSALSDATLLLFVARDGPDARAEDAAHFYEGHERLVYDSICAVFDSKVALEEDDHDTLLYHGLFMSGRIRIPDSSLHPKLLALKISRSTPNARREFASGSRMTHELIATRQKLRTCSGPGCTMAAATRPTDAAKLQACGRCKLMLYCGRACQQADWKNDRDRAPHKVLCPILCKLAEAGALDVDKTSQEFAEVYDRAGLSQAEFSVLLLWARTSPELCQPGMYAQFL